MGFTFCQDENGRDFFPVGLQAHNSSTGTELIGKAIQAVKAYGGNCLEAPVYWYRLEPEKDVYEMELVKDLRRPSFCTLICHRPCVSIQRAVFVLLPMP